jgi:transposase-like protein
MAMKNGRRKFTGEEKMAILRRHLVEKVPVSDVCDQAGINPTLFYRWQKELFENGAAAFGRRSDEGPSRKLEAKVEALEKKLADKDEVIAEIMEDHVRLKKSLGET